MKFLATTALVLSLAIAAPALAQDAAKQDEALQHNDAYNAAMEAGDYDRAATAAMAAWEAAEAGWGDNPNTAALAMQATVTYLDLGRPGEAREAAARTVALAGVADGAYSEGDARLWHGLTLIGDPAAAAELEAGLAAADAAGTVSEDTVRGRLMLAALQRSGDGTAALATAQKAVDDARTLESPNLRAHLFELGKMQYLSGQFGPAVMTLTESLNLWERQPVGEMAQPLADTLAWHTMASKAQQTSAPAAPAAPAPGGFGGGFGGFGGFGWGFLPERECEIEWAADNAAVNFPTPQGQANLGAAVIMYDITEEGTVSNVRIVSAVPTRQEAQEQIILNGMGGWRTDGGVPGRCREGQVQTTSYFF